MKSTIGSLLFYIPGVKLPALVFVLMAATLMSCENSEVERNDVKYYYDLKGFINNQIIVLNEKKPKVTKDLIIDGHKEVSTTNDVDWKKELELFIQSDLNKPSYQQSYTVVRADSLSYEYILKPGEDLPIRHLDIKLDSATHQPVAVHALLKSENKIYTSEKNISLTCTKRENLLEISSYSVAGYQKLAFMKRKSFNVSAKIGL
ncbi:hypothetical protein [Dyadobacter bucti]|uniref:hypothetical protein n=1 Tax=Dyadobacter bucti TaxID=2572203 RepID=UPI001E5376F5|nr:hypothetical protein [Dyadobacter bucti]